VDATLKNRLIGTAVILALAALLLPWVLDGANHESLLAESRLPPPPHVPSAEELLTPPPAEAPAAVAEIDALHAAATPEAPPVVIPPVGTPAATSVVPAPATVIPPAAPAPVAAEQPPAPPAGEAERLAALAEAWDLQVAALSSAEGAARLRDALLAAGYKARVQANRDGRGLNRVLVGPVLRREDALALRDRLAADRHLKDIGTPLLVRYVP
jgi:DedD protein